MKLTAELARNIVISSMEVLGKNINIMDESGIILASGNRARINTFHQGAAKVIATGEMLEISKDEEFEGSAPGINLPIEFNKQIIGVVGITGDPDEVRIFGKLVKNSVELMLKESFVLQQLQAETKARERLLHELLQGNLAYDEDFIEKARLVGCEILFPLVVIAIDIQAIGNMPLKKWLGQTPRRELDLENIVSNIIEHLNNTKTSQSIITSIGTKRIVILQFIATKFKNDDKSAAEIASTFALKYLEQLKTVYNVKVSIGIGGVAHDIQETRGTYKEACLVLKIADKLSYEGDIHCWHDIGLGLLLETTSREVAEYFEKSVNLPELLDSKLVNTLRVFLDCNLCVNETAKKLYVHRNTLTYRLNQIKKITGLDPRNFYGAMHLYLSLMLDRYHSDRSHPGTRS
ncbi:MAG: sugar diacid recognition domain-containing protein [Thermacetogeniaceae bacterium]